MIKKLTKKTGLVKQHLNKERGKSQHQNLIKSRDSPGYQSIIMHTGEKFVIFLMKLY